MDAGLIALQALLISCAGVAGVLACASIRHTRDLFTEDGTDG